MLTQLYTELRWPHPLLPFTPNLFIVTASHFFSDYRHSTKEGRLKQQANVSATLSANAVSVCAQRHFKTSSVDDPVALLCTAIMPPSLLLYFHQSPFFTQRHVFLLLFFFFCPEHLLGVSILPHKQTNKPGGYQRRHRSAGRRSRSLMLLSHRVVLAREQPDVLDGGGVRSGFAWVIDWGSPEVADYI